MSRNTTPITEKRRVPKEIPNYTQKNLKNYSTNRKEYKMEKGKNDLELRITNGIEKIH